VPSQKQCAVENIDGRLADCEFLKLWNDRQNNFVEVISSNSPTTAICWGMRPTFLITDACHVILFSWVCKLQIRKVHLNWQVRDLSYHGESLISALKSSRRAESRKSARNMIGNYVNVWSHFSQTDNALSLISVDYNENSSVCIITLETHHSPQRSSWLCFGNVRRFLSHCLPFRSLFYRRTIFLVGGQQRTLPAHCVNPFNWQIWHGTLW